MTRTNLSMSISADGYVAGPDQSEENPPEWVESVFTIGILGRQAITRSTGR